MSQWHGVVATAAAVVVVIVSLDVLLASTAAAAAVTPAHAQHPDTLVRNAAAGVRGFGRLPPVSPEAAAGAVKKARALSLLELGVALVSSDGSPDRRTLALAHGDDIDAAVRARCRLLAGAAQGCARCSRRHHVFLIEDCWWVCVTEPGRGVCS